MKHFWDHRRSLLTENSKRGFKKTDISTDGIHLLPDYLKEELTKIEIRGNSVSTENQDSTVPEFTISHAGGQKGEIAICSDNRVLLEEYGDISLNETSELTVTGKSKQKITEGINLLPYPYYNTTRITEQITWIDEGDGAISVYGTSEEGTYPCFDLAHNFTLEAGTYTAGGIGEFSMFGYADGKWTGFYENTPITLSSARTFTKIYLQKGSSTSYTVNEVLRPMLVSGRTVPPIYIKPTFGKGSPSPDYPSEIENTGNKLSVTVCGKNLLDLSLISCFTIKGVCWTPKQDGTVSANGTASGRSEYKIGSLSLSPGTYRVGGCPDGGEFLQLVLYLCILYGNGQSQKKVL